MNFTQRCFQRYSSYFIVGLICTVLGFTGGVFANIEKYTIVKSFEDVKFVPMDPKRPDGTQWSVLWGDPTIGPSAVLAKYKKSNGRVHSHSSDFHMVLLKGEIKYWSADESEAEAKLMKEGSYMFQPGNVTHGETCVTDECVVFMKWADKKDTKFPEVK